MIVSSIKQVDDMYEIAFDHDGREVYYSILHGPSCWVDIRKWGLADRIKRPTDIVGMEVAYSDVFNCEDDYSEQKTIASIIVPVTMYEAIASYFDEWMPAPKGSHIQHHVHENDVDANGDPTFVVWGIPFGLTKYWDIMEPHLKANYPNKFWQAIRADKKPILIEYLKMLRTQREKAS